MLSTSWRERLLGVLVDSLVVPDHALKSCLCEMRLRDMGIADLKELFSESSVSEQFAGTSAC